jgi:hypothetical protein
VYVEQAATPSYVAKSSQHVWVLHVQVNVEISADKCGSCSNNCTAKPNVASATCNKGVCNLTCSAGFRDCDGIATNGCEVSTCSPAPMPSLGNANLDVPAAELQ